MARPPLPIGERGNIKRTKQPDGSWIASCRYRDADGVTRQVRAEGPSGQKAENRLKAKLKQRGQGDGITSEHRVSELAEQWFATVDKAPGTRSTYRHVLDRHILPGVGALLIREATTARLDQFIRAVSKQRTVEVINPKTGHVSVVKKGGPTSARQCRTVLSLMLGMAARYGAVATNPVRDTSTPVVKRDQIRAMTMEEFQNFFAHLRAWESARSYGPAKNASVLDVVDLFVATGLRPGELLAVRFDDISFKAGTLSVTGTIKRTTEDGLHRQDHAKSAHGHRVLRLPQFALLMLRRRKLAQGKGLVFTNRLGGIWEPANFSRVWVSARGEEWAWVKPSSFRKAVATIIEREAGSLIASKQLGHSSDAVTLKHYIERLNAAPDSTEVLERFRSGDRLLTALKKSTEAEP